MERKVQKSNIGVFVAIERADVKTPLSLVLNCKTKSPKLTYVISMGRMKWHPGSEKSRKDAR
jgi:hypothetical protein